jgi:hypothetical protein
VLYRVLRRASHKIAASRDTSRPGSDARILQMHLRCGFAVKIPFAIAKRDEPLSTSMSRQIETSNGFSFENGSVANTSKNDFRLNHVRAEFALVPPSRFPIPPKFVTVKYKQNPNVSLVGGVNGQRGSRRFKPRV